MTIQQFEQGWENPASAIFVDIPNVASSRVDGRKRRIVWSALAKAILDNNDLQDTNIRYTAVYSQYKREADVVASLIGPVMRTRLPTYVEAVTRTDKDIDSLIMNDIWQSVVGHQQSTIVRSGRLQFPLQIRHILVSGDAGYLRAYKGLAQVYGDYLQRELIVYSWRDSLNHEFATVANQIHFLDDIPGLVQSNEPVI
ncbi:MAG: hypothetical protein KA104_00625 [Candidatus Pacebacteria bacterium]|nr:hypothetical protein [Candidatus Paceibacterota bacterium]